MSEKQVDQIRDAVRNKYAEVAQGKVSCCGGNETSSCCDSEQLIVSIGSEQLGYNKEQLASLPEGADMGLGCGNPQAIAALKPGEVLLDLGSGGGFDCFLAAPIVGPTGKVIGVDMTPEMVSKARANARKSGHGNVEFRLGEIEHLPVADNTADVIISNCVINLSPDKPSVFHDAFRVLKPGGRLAISDVVAVKPLPENLLNDEHLLCGCVSGAALVEDLRDYMGVAGFTEIAIELKPESREFIKNWAPGTGIEEYVVSAMIEAIKPG